LAETDAGFHDLLTIARYESYLGQRIICTFNNIKEIAVNKGHMSALQLKHAELEAQLENENNRPFPDDDLIHRIKKQKLQIKDMLATELAHA
jgi:hypothetical protein